ncbi:hypothetical protein WMZ97_11605 [Lentibacillus sp. N15]|uniref:hypothetical protein n=1 Tax=Lentibacillus songyuanensis TaxID=3136161 RepID=UPI0031BB54E7
MIIDAEKPGFSREEIKKRLERLDTGRTYQVQRLVFYPYFIFEYIIDRQNFFHPLKGHVGCTVDGVNKVGALADTFPQFTKQEISDRDIINPYLAFEEAEEIAEDYLYHSISTKKKVLTVPKIAATKQKLFYRPYWVVEGSIGLTDPFLITIDAVSGKFHPL